MRLTEDNIRDAIESQYEWVYPGVGNKALAPTGEPYVVYALGVKGPKTEKTVEFLLRSLFSTFLVMRGGCVPLKPEGSQIVLDDPEPTSIWNTYGKYLYWRHLPEIVYDVGEDVTKIRTRVCISRKKVED